MFSQVGAFCLFPFNCTSREGAIISIIPIICKRKYSHFPTRFAWTLAAESWTTSQKCAWNKTDYFIRRRHARLPRYVRVCLCMSTHESLDRLSIISEFTQYHVSIQRQDACQVNVITAHAREVCSTNYDIWKLCTLTNVILVCLWNRMLDFRAKLLIVVPTDSITVTMWTVKTENMTWLNNVGSTLLCCQKGKYRDIKELWVLINNCTYIYSLLHICDKHLHIILNCCNQVCALTQSDLKGNIYKLPAILCINVL